MLFTDRNMLRRAALLALRGFGRVEPNPMVGCVLASPLGEVIGMGHHRAVGGDHAEIEALNNARSRGFDPRGSTMWVTLEPCNHTGRTGPCAEAIIDAGVSRVVVARRDPTPEASGGIERLRAAGVGVDLVPQPLARAVSEPFAKRARTGLPWVIAKWAQTLDGRIATSNGESQWISGPVSRRSVHRLRGMVGAVLTGAGSVEADDPRLTARGVPTRRTARRVVIDPRARMRPSANLIATIDEAPLCVATLTSDSPAALELSAAGAEIIAVPGQNGSIDLRALLAHLAEDGVHTVLVEAGPGTLGPLFDGDFVDEAIVYIAPSVMSDGGAPGPVGGAPLARLSDSRRFVFWHTGRRGSDACLRAIRVAAD